MWLEVSGMWYDQQVSNGRRCTSFRHAVVRAMASSLSVQVDWCGTVLYSVGLYWREAKERQPHRVAKASRGDVGLQDVLTQLCMAARASSIDDH